MDQTMDAMDKHQQTADFDEEYEDDDDFEDDDDEEDTHDAIYQQR